MPSSSQGPTRLFRVDTPHDVACAAVVASTLPPGRDILVYSTDKSSGAPKEFGARVLGMSRVHPWSAVVDISGLPLAKHLLAPGLQGGRWRRLMDTVEAPGFLATRLADALGLQSSGPRTVERVASAVDELYVTCLHHPDVQVFCGFLSEAKLCYSPHGFDSLHGTETHHYSPLCGPRAGMDVPALRRIVERAKVTVFGSASVLPRRLEVARAYSFNLPMPWARENVDLSGALGRGLMTDFFSRLPPEVRAAYEGLAARCGSDAVLILLPPHDKDPRLPHARQVEVVAGLARSLSERVRSDTFLLKPHPLNSVEEVDTMRRAVERELPRASVELVRQFGEYPIEVVFAPFAIRSVGGVDSSSMRTLKKIYGTTSYCPEQALLALYEGMPTNLDSIRRWVEDNRPHYTAV